MIQTFAKFLGPVARPRISCKGRRFFPTAVLLLGAAGKALAASKAVLILSGVQFGLPTSDFVVGGAVGALQAKQISVNHIYVEHLDLVRSGGPAQRRALADLLQQKLKNVDIGLVVVANKPALSFLAEEGRELLPAGTPVLTTLIENPAAAWRNTPPPILNVVARPDLPGTIRYGLELFPSTRRVVAIGSSGNDREPVYQLARQALAAQAAHLTVEDTDGLAYEEMLERVGNLPPDAIVLMGSYFRDKTQRSFVPVEVAAEIAKRANRPTLAMYDTQIKTGLTGGSAMMTPLIGQRVGEIAAAFLSGTTSPEAGIAEQSLPAVPLFDWRQVKRWGGDPGKLPADTLFLNQPRTLWGEYREAVIIFGVAMALLSSLVVALAIENRRRRRVEQALVGQQQQLEIKVAERTAQLVETTHKAEAANIAKSRFLANMSHEIRTPLNAIIGLTQLLRKKPLDKDAHEKLMNVQTSGKHLLQVINDILDYSKIEAGKLEVLPEAMNVQTIPSNVVSMLAEAAAGKGIALLTEVGEMPRLLRGDSMRITQALLNLAGNAIKFTASGSVRIRIGKESETAAQVVLRFEVIDTGMGIPAECLGALFQPFQQGDDSTAKRFGGTGLGLVITRRLAELMGGEAGAESTLGVGSRFWFTVICDKLSQPEQVQVMRSDDEPLQALATRFAGCRVLLVEDEIINQMVAQENLEDAKLSVDIAGDGQEALEKLQLATPGQYSLILMDMQMPRMDGLTATRAIRQLPVARHLPIIAMTANAFDEDRERCLAAGMNDFIAKPFAPEALFATLLRWLSLEQAPGVTGT